ncbi:MAG: enoyl-CoA hydratase/isomerase family protein [Bradymonadaceae bacterium]
MTTFDTIKVEEHDDGIVMIMVSRPDKLNALNPQVLSELKEAATALHDRQDLRVVILTGEGRAFVAGADIAAMNAFTADEALEFGRAGHQTMNAISAIPVPVIAAVNGFALGGGLELALSCDLIYVSSKAKLGLPEVGLGIIPGFGGTQRLGRFIGWHAARELVFTGRTIDAEEAHRLGLALDVIELEGFADKIFENARLIASRGPIAVRVAKRIMREGRELPLDAANRREVESFAGLWETEDRTEGMAAFLEKRQAGFKG